VIFIRRAQVHDQQSVESYNEQWHSAWVRVRYMSISACVWRDYAMIRRLSGRGRFWETCLRPPCAPCRKMCIRNNVRLNPF